MNAQITSWLLLLQQFDLTIIDKPRRENVVAYFLSKSVFPTGEEGMVDDQLSYEHLLAILVLTLSFSDIANYLVAAQFPPNLSSKEKRRIIRKGTPFTWIGHNIFKLCLNQILRRCVMEEEFSTSFWHVMMGLGEISLHPKEQPSRYFKLVITSPLSTKMHESIPTGVIGAR